MKLLYIGIMGGDNGFTKAMSKEFDFIQLPVERAEEALAIDADIVFFQIQRNGFRNIGIIKNIKGFKINWTGDVRDTIPKWMKHFARYIDLTTFSNMRDVINMRKEGFKSEWLDIGYDPEIYNPAGDVADAPDIIYQANNWNHFPMSPLRKQVITALSEMDFKVYGEGYPESFMYDQGAQAALYRGCKIAINLSNYQVRRYSSDRILRLMGSGAFCLSHRWEEMLYEDGKHLVCWDSISDLKDKINYYLYNPKERIKIARAGQKLVRDRDTFDNMARNIHFLYLKNK